MYINVISNMKNISIFNFYFNNKNFILGVLILCLLLIFMGTAIGKLDDQNFCQLIKNDICIKDVITIISVLTLGMILNAVGMKIEFKLNHIPILLFFYSSVLLFIIQAIEYFQYKNTHKKIIGKTLDLYIKIIESIMFLLMVMDRLENIEFVAMIMIIIVFRLYTFLLDDEKIQISNKAILKEDYPVKKINELFESRQRQLNNICAELERKR